MEKRQFDEKLGGHVFLPRNINLLKFLAARAPEMMAMTRYLESLEAKKQTSKKIPMHMRRRLMSHHAKRKFRPSKTQETSVSEAFTSHEKTSDISQCKTNDSMTNKSSPRTDKKIKPSNSKKKALKKEQKT
ncbi:ribonucleases P/MRP protein subunit POP1-like [Chelonus insularis]|uniref:ribonucleases P/MRP protein subunit POP1-like n=1 Tax=Chelonus insularis TaxID=460826 RepID=UPI0015886EB2|nr:ribonucleases P/MRP protein subunit POP1-like [Chelonus insularis]XP_034944268.1 ribonucleases P/MRP protein subunit POP1-like [Chelonus insularis]